MPNESDNQLTTSDGQIRIQLSSLHLASQASKKEAECDAETQSEEEMLRIFEKGDKQRRQNDQNFRPVLSFQN